MDCSKFNVDDVMTSILGHEKITIKEYMAVISECFRYCSSSSTDKGSIIYKRLKTLLHKFIASEAKKIAACVADEDRLRQYRAAWEKFAFSSRVTSNMFKYVDTHWVSVLNDRSEQAKKTTMIPNVYTLCMLVWKEEMFVQNGLDISRSAVNLMNRHRGGDSGVDENLIKALVESLVALGEEFKKTVDPFGNIGQEEKAPGDDVLTEEAKAMLQNYENLFEVQMLEETQKYYEKESAAVIEDGDIMAYMRKTEERLTEEAERSRRCLHDIITNKRLQKAVESAYIEERLDLFQGEFRNLLVAERIGDLQLMFRLCSRVEKAVQQLKTDLRDYVAEKGREAIANIPPTEQNDPRIYVHTALKVYEKFHDMVSVAFANDSGFSEYFERGCALMINQNRITQGSKAPGKTSEMLGRFVDVMMRKGGSDDFEKAVDQTMTFFKFIEDKDVFQKYYNRFLGKRLLMELSVSDDAETSMISRLKTACGHQYTATAHKMIQDMTISKQITADFKKDHKPSLEIDANFQILNSGCWPYNQSATFSIPPVLQDAMNAFGAFYARVHQGRKLNMLLSASRGELNTKCFARKYTFVASTAQMVVLLRFNQNTTIALADFKEDLNMPEELLQSVLASFVKADLIKKCDSAAYELNEKFTSKRLKLDLQKLQLAVKDGGEAAKKEQQALEKSLDEDRKVVIQAAIVRIMKMRRRLQHNALITEVVEQVTARFQPRIPMIKKCIDLLMEKQYVERSKDDKDFYEYIS